LDLALVLAGEVLERRRDLAAGTAPGGPEVHQHRDLRLQDLFLEVVVAHIDDVRTGHGSSLPCSNPLHNKLLTVLRAGLSSSAKPGLCPPPGARPAARPPGPGPVAPRARRGTGSSWASRGRARSRPETAARRSRTAGAAGAASRAARPWP